jgi:hypothetical protein
MDKQSWKVSLEVEDLALGSAMPLHTGIYLTCVHTVDE